MEMNEKNILKLFNESGSYEIFKTFKDYKKTPKDKLSKKIFNIINDFEFRIYGEITIIKEINSIIIDYLNLDRIKK
jgi:hypothetical protein